MKSLIILFLAVLAVQCTRFHKMKMLKKKTKETINMGKVSNNMKEQLASYSKPQISSAPLGVASGDKRHYSFVDNKQANAYSGDQSAYYTPQGFNQYGQSQGQTYPQSYGQSSSSTQPTAYSQPQPYQASAYNQGQSYPQSTAYSQPQPYQASAYNQTQGYTQPQTYGQNSPYGQSTAYSQSSKYYPPESSPTSYGTNSTSANFTPRTVIF